MLVSESVTYLCKYNNYPCTKKINCDLQHVYNWVMLFTYTYNSRIKNIGLILNGDNEC